MKYFIKTKLFVYSFMFYICGLWLVYYLNTNVLGHLTRTVKSIEHTNLVCFYNVFSYKAYVRVFKYFFLKKNKEKKRRKKWYNERALGYTKWKEKTWLTLVNKHHIR